MIFSMFLLYLIINMMINLSTFIFVCVCVSGIINVYVIFIIVCILPRSVYTVKLMIGSMYHVHAIARHDMYNRARGRGGVRDHIVLS